MFDTTSQPVGQPILNTPPDSPLDTPKSPKVPESSTPR
jgi:hypothetical protein